jgi:hypothetical protein
VVEKKDLPRAKENFSVQLAKPLPGPSERKTDLSRVPRGQ